MYPTKEETALWVAINLSQRRLYRQMDAALKAAELPPLRWYDVLWAVEQRGESGMRAFELEQGLLFEQSNLSRLLQRLVKEGLIHEAVCPEDRRGKTLTISKQGASIRKSMWEVYGPLMHQHLAGIDDSKMMVEIASHLNSLHASVPDSVSPAFTGRSVNKD